MRVFASTLATRTAVAAAGAALLLAAAPAIANPAANAAATPAAAAVRYDAAGTSRLLVLVNSHRAGIGLRPLAVDPRLAAIARTHTTWMATSGQLVHNDALFTRATHEALRISRFGENIALNDTLDGAHAALLRSPPHRANVENGAFAVGGFAVVVDGKGLVWVTQAFGSAPRPVATSPVVRTAPVAPVRLPPPRVPPRPAARPAPRPAPRRAAPARPAPSVPATPAAHLGALSAADAVAPATAPTVAAPRPAAPTAPRPAALVSRHRPARPVWPAAALLLLVGLGLGTARRSATLGA